MSSNQCNQIVLTDATDCVHITSSHLRKDSLLMFGCGLLSVFRNLQLLLYTLHHSPTPCHSYMKNFCYRYFLWYRIYTNTLLFIAAVYYFSIMDEKNDNNLVVCFFDYVDICRFISSTETFYGNERLSPTSPWNSGGYVTNISLFVLALLLQGQLRRSQRGLREAVSNTYEQTWRDPAQSKAVKVAQHGGVEFPPIGLYMDRWSWWPEVIWH